MATQVMFGKAGANAPVHMPRATPPAQPVSSPAPQNAAPSKNQYAGMDNLNEVDFGRTFASKYAEDSSTFVIFILWFFLGGAGAHRLYMGNKMIAAAMVGLGAFNGFLWLTGGVTAYLSYKAGTGVMSGGLISAIVVMVFHFCWIFFDFFYILVRKFTSK